MRWLRDNLHTNALWRPPNPTRVGDALPPFPLLQRVPEEMVGESGIGFNLATALLC